MSLDPNIERKLLADPEFRTFMRDAATLVRNRALMLAKAAHEPWWLRRGAEVISVEQEAGRTYVVNHDHLGHIAEWGGRYQGPQAPLRRAVRAAGLNLRESPKE